ncbi:hypothetical protein [Frankia sp. R82]|uniref:hypothetical protein n=1 Tax=Frankia sp. R82 TaxID=2950553 RepID=UPI002044014B|nr:hypothetical protein [Frankia sp. R82]MCM3887643.1 hypothetical protein [Frankia sp. R82]
MHLTQPKTDAGIRELVLDDQTVEEFHRHRERQRDERQTMGLDWDPTGPVFTTLHGNLVHPASISTTFVDLVAQAGVPPIRVHDGRHVAATLMHTPSRPATALRALTRAPRHPSRQVGVCRRAHLAAQPG